MKDSSLEPNYAARCDRHHYLPGKEYTFFTLKPLGEAASRGDGTALYREIEALHCDKEHSELYHNLLSREVPLIPLSLLHSGEGALLSVCRAEPDKRAAACEDGLRPRAGYPLSFQGACRQPPSGGLRTALSALKLYCQKRIN